MLMKRHPGFEKPEIVVRRAIHELGPAVEVPFRRYYVLWHWKEIVGDVFARNVRPIYIRFKNLHLYTLSSAWKNEVLLMQEDIISKVNQFAGEKMVEAIKFGYDTSKEEEKDILSLREYEDSLRKKKSVDKKIEVNKILLPPQEVEEVSKNTAQVENEELRETLERFLIKVKKTKRYLLEHGFHKCAGCERLVSENEKYCFFCRQRLLLEKKRAVRRLLSNAPWLRYGEISKHVFGVSPDFVNRQRAEMVQELTQGMSFSDKATLKGKYLTMLYLGVPPEQLTDKLVERTFIKLGRNMPWDEEFYRQLKEQGKIKPKS